MAFVNWKHVNTIYCGMIWMIALVLAMVILIQCLPRSTAPAHRARAVVMTR